MPDRPNILILMTDQHARDVLGTYGNQFVRTPNLDALAGEGMRFTNAYCSDHGEMAGEHGCWWKSNYYEGSAGVPLMARLPGVVPSGTVQPAVCNLVDLGVTAIDVAGGPPIRRTDGRSLWPTLPGESPRRLGGRDLLGVQRGEVHRGSPLREEIWSAATRRRFSRTPNRAHLINKR